jgi:hypothetical protein
MPAEFWREVVDRVAAEVPGTLLLAEAFWLLEGYFVRSLGMHRVYNSAFMHMLRDEDIGAYRRLVRDTIEFDPEILERYVNFMSNPDEATAVEQFGRGDKYFGVATALATLPGLPMLGHGQVEGLAEKYGMEFRRPAWDEAPDATMIERHEREIAPLLRDRWRFARAADFRLYDLVRDDGSVDERVLAYSNGRGAGRSLVAYLGVFGDTAGWLRECAAYAVKAPDGSKGLVRQHIAEALELPSEAGSFVTFRDRRTGLEHLRQAGEIRERGLRVSLGAYGCLVLDGFRDLGTGGRWADLAQRLGDRGVPSLDDALRDLELEPLHDRLRGLARDGHLSRLAAALDRPGRAIPRGEAASELGPAITAGAEFAALLAEFDTSGGAEPADQRAARSRVEEALARISAMPRARAPLAARETRLELVVAILLSRIDGADAGDPSAVPQGRRRFDGCRLAGPLVEALQEAGLDPDTAREAVARIRAVAGLNGTPPGPETADEPAAFAVRTLGDQAVREAAGVNSWDGVEWLAQEAWEAFVDLWVLLSAATAPSEVAATTAFRRGGQLRAIAAAAGYRLDRLGEADPD